MTITDHLARLGGARPDLIDQAPGDRPKFVTLAGVMLATSAVAALSMVAALIIALDLPVWLAIPIAIGWGGLILLFDRMMVLSMPYEEGRSVRRALALAAPRITIAIVIGTIVSTPLTIFMFHSEIDAEIEVMQAEENADFEAALDADPRFAGEAELRETIRDAQAAIASVDVIDPSSDPAYIAAKHEADVRHQVYLDTQLRVEADPESSDKAAALAVAKGAYDAAQAQFLAIAASTTAALQAQSESQASAAQDELAMAQPDLEAMVALRDAETAAYAGAVAASDGMIARLEALERTSGRSAWGAISHIALAVLFILIELLPVLVKVLVNLGKPSFYDRLAVISDESRASQARAIADSRERGAQALADADVASAEHRATHHLELQKLINDKVAEVQTKAMQRALNDWARTAGRETRRRIAEANPTTPGTAP